MFNNIYEGKRVLVTGHTGFKGSWLSHWLIELGAKVAGYSLFLPSTPCNFEILKLSQRLHHTVGDVRDLPSVLKVFSDFQPHIVFHLAAQAIVRKSYDDPKLTFDTNLGGTINVLEAIRQTPSVKSAVIITSDKCYENMEWEYGYRETDQLGGKDPYSASKACAEIAISSYVRSFFLNGDQQKIASTRAGNVIGGGDWAMDRIVPDCIRSWAKGETVIVRSPEATRPWQHVLEPLSGYLWLGSKLLSSSEGLSGEAFNFGPSPEVTQSVADLIEEMKKIWPEGRWKNASDSTVHKKEAGLLKLSCDKALRHLSWKATLSYEETVRLTTEWYLRFYKEKKDMVSFTTEQISDYKHLARERNLPWAR